MAFIADNIKLISSLGGSLAAFAAVGTTYVTAGGPIPATRQYVIAQSEQLKSRLIDNSIQTNKLQLDLLRKEQIDRQVQIQTEQNQQVKNLYQDRLNAVGDAITGTIQKNNELEHEKSQLGK